MVINIAFIWFLHGHVKYVHSGLCYVWGASVSLCGRGRRSRGGAALAFTVVVREIPQRSLEVGRSLLLDLVSEWVDLEAVQSKGEKNNYIHRKFMFY